MLLPLNILEELVKPITLALRLFGNIFAGGIMLALIGLHADLRRSGPRTSSGRPSTCSSAAIQAFIFALLTVLYFAMAGAGHGDDDHDEEQADDAGRAATHATSTTRPRGDPRTCALTGDAGRA